MKHGSHKKSVARSNTGKKIGDTGKMNPKGNKKSYQAADRYK